MDKDAIKDYGATGLGGGSGLDMIYSGVDGMLKDGVDTPEVKLIVYGLFLVIGGFFAWRKRQGAATVAP